MPPCPTLLVGHNLCLLRARHNDEKGSEEKKSNDGATYLRDGTQDRALVADQNSGFGQI